jgi:hypothetical protein
LIDDCVRKRERFMVWNLNLGVEKGKVALTLRVEKTLTKNKKENVFGGYESDKLGYLLIGEGTGIRDKDTPYS